MGRVDLLVLGGTHHVGRSVVECALARGYSVTTLNRGMSGGPAEGVRPLYADRTAPSELRSALGAGSWDAVVDTWSGAPRVVQDAASLLAGRVSHYCYVSSRSVYRWPLPVGSDESAPVVDGDPSSTDVEDYAARKRGGELAVLDAFGDQALLARAGLILGPYELVGRLPWWLRRFERGGPVACPGPYSRPLQYIDGRDLAEWVLTATEDGAGGAFNTVSRPGHTTIGELLDTVRLVTGDRALPVWVTPSQVEDAGVAPWTELPIWVPPDGELAGLHAADVSAAYARGLRCRPVVDTVGDTWAWQQAEGDPPAVLEGTIGLPVEKETQLLTLPC
jgi:2'-hydroxyisoflavone reductase